MSKNVIGAILIVGAIVLGFLGYGASQPTMQENMMGGIGGALALAGNPEMQQKLDDLKSAQFRRGLPYYVLGFLAGVGGVVVLVRNKQTG